MLHAPVGNATSGYAIAHNQLTLYQLMNIDCNFTTVNTLFRAMNNNPEVFTNDQRPIVEFSIENRKALNARQKRLEKSREKNPNFNKDNVGKAKNKSGKGKSTKNG